MRIVKCYECGKRYNYDEDGFCPRCGAFNQPPSASRIGADGSVIWVEGINSRNHEGSFVHKELHEENRERKGTALERDEKKKRVITRSGSTVIRQPLTQRDGTPAYQQSAARKKQGGGAIFWAFLILVFLLQMFGWL